MRFLILLLVVGSALAAELRFAWDSNDPAEQVTDYRFYTSTNVTGPYTLLGSTGTNTTFTVTNAFAGQAFYYVTAMNMWGESDPSDKVVTPKRASGVNSLRLQFFTADARKYVSDLILARVSRPSPPK